MLKDERYSNAPQAEDDRDESVHNLDKINVLDMMSVNQIKPVLAPWNMWSKTCAGCKYRGMDDVSLKKAPVYAR